jgi:hypothetical protein
LLVLLGDLTFMDPCIVSIFQYTCISNKMQSYTVYLYLETVLHVSGGTSAHHQERIQLYLQHLVFVTALLLSAAIVEELEPVWVCCGWRTPVLSTTGQASCAYRHTGFVLLVRACVLQSCDAYWLPNLFSCFPFTSPPVRHLVPSHFKRSLTTYGLHNAITQKLKTRCLCPAKHW